MNRRVQALQIGIPNFMVGDMKVCLARPAVALRDWTTS
jgi:hypothetical protein